VKNTNKGGIGLTIHPFQIELKRKGAWNISNQVDLLIGFLLFVCNGSFPEHEQGTPPN
jgi:hypothetical protein